MLQSHHHMAVHLEGEGAVMFKHACKLRLEGIVSKRRDMRYRSGRCKAWLKIKDPKSPAMLRVDEGTFWRALLPELYDKRTTYCLALQTNAIRVTFRVHIGFVAKVIVEILKSSTN